MRDPAATAPRGGVPVRPGPELEVVGAAPSAALVGEVRRAVEAAARKQPPLRRTDGVAASAVGGRPLVALYSVQHVPGGQAVYAVPIDTVGVRVLLARASREFQLLPPTVLPEAVGPDVFRLSVGPAGLPVVSTAAPGAAAAAAAREASPALGGLFLTAEITPAGAEVLARPTMTPAQVTGLGALFLLALALAALAYRQLRREEELVALREDFVARASHELRTPLALQRIFLDTVRLGRAASPERMSWAMENLDREARRLEHLIGNVLSFARARRGRLELTPVRVDVAAAVERTVSALRPLAEQRGMVLHVPDSEPLDVDLDEPSFQQALGNVLENAIRYGPDGQVITVRWAEEEGTAVVEVEDQGPGVPPAERELVLEAFRRGQDAGSTAVAGSGIGLAVARAVVELHGGWIRLDAAPAGGLRVRLAFPGCRAPAAGAVG